MGTHMQNEIPPNTIIGVFSNRKTSKRLFHELIRRNYHFIVILISGSAMHLRTSLSKSVYFLDATDFMKHTRFNNPSAEPAMYTCCFIAISVPSYHFKRLWNAQKRLESIMPPGLTICNAVLVKSASRRYNIINFYNNRNPCGSSSKEALILLPCGIGDLISMAHILKAFVDQRTQSGIHVDIYYASESSYVIGPLFFQEAGNKKISHKFSPNAAWTEYDNVYNLGSIDYLASSRNYEISMLLNGRFITDVDALRTLLPLLPKRVARKLEKLRRRYRYIIGVQFRTEHNHPITRNYHAPSARHFVQECRRLGIAVVNLAPCPRNRLRPQMDCGQIAIKFLPSIIGKLDMVVGIDSCCVHIAAMTGTPCIVLHNRLYSYTINVIRLCYNIVSKSGDLQDVPYRVIIERVQQIIKRELSLPTEVNPYNGWNSDNTEYL